MSSWAITDYHTLTSGISPSPTSMQSTLTLQRTHSFPPSGQAPMATQSILHAYTLHPFPCAHQQNTVPRFLAPRPAVTVGQPSRTVAHGSGHAQRARLPLPGPTPPWGAPLGSALRAFGPPSGLTRLCPGQKLQRGQEQAEAGP